MTYRLVIVLMLAGVVARADDSLDAWIATATAKNPGVIAARQKWEMAKQKAPQARSLEDPMIGVDFERMGTTRFDTYSDAEWMISQKLPWFGKRGARSSAAALEAEATGFEYVAAMRRVRADVKSAYWDLWLAQKAVEVTGENKKLMEQFAEIARARYETGDGMQADLLRAQVEAAKMGNESITMEQEASVAQSAVNRLLNEPLATPRQAGDADLPAVATSQQNNPAVAAMARMRQSKEAAVHAAKLESAPDIEFRVEARSYNGQSGIKEYDTGVFMNFPWLWHGKYAAMVREAKADLAMAAADFDNELNMTLMDVKDLSTKTDSGSRLMKLYEKTVLPQARQLVESTRASYQVGKSSFLDLVEAQRAMKDAQLDYYRVRAQYAKDAARLEELVAPWSEQELATGLMTANKR